MIGTSWTDYTVAARAAVNGRAAILALLKLAARHVHIVHGGDRAALGLWQCAVGALAALGDDEPIGVEIVLAVQDAKRFLLRGVKLDQKHAAHQLMGVGAASTLADLVLAALLEEGGPVLRSRIAIEVGETKIGQAAAE